MPELRSESTGGERRLSEPMLALLRERVAARYYDRPDVLDRLARALVAQRPRPPIT